MKKVIFLCTCLVLILLPSAYGLSRGDAFSLIADHGPMMHRIAEAGLAYEAPGVMEGLLLKLYGVESVHLGEDKVLFFLPYAGEGYKCLIYIPSGQYIPPSLASYDNWTSVETQDASLRWEGGMMNRGYINLWQLDDNFYLEEACLPT